MSATNFYRAFEDRYRGSRELICERLRVYLPFILPLLDAYKPATAVDLGCGRGEWLELLTKHGFQSHGVDLDTGMLAACTELGLMVTQQDALTYLESLSDESQCIVSGFHIIEHIAFEHLNAIVRQAMRVLKPGGLLILETPNPENLVVGTSNFYLDPTHVRPIPPLLLSFLPEHYGFARVRTLRLQEQNGLLDRPEIGLMDVFGGASPDYSVVAQKAAIPGTMAKFDACFAAHHGIELHQLADRYDHSLAQKMRVIDQRLTTTEAQAGGVLEALSRIGSLQDRLVDNTAELARIQVQFDHLQYRAEIAEAQAQEQRQRAEAAEAQAQEQRQRAEAAEAQAQEQRRRAEFSEALAQEHLRRVVALEAEEHDLHRRINELRHSDHQWWLQAGQFEGQCNALRQSVSWRVTAPIRFVAGLMVHPGTTLSGSANHFLQRTIVTAQRPLAGLMAAVLRRPNLAYRLNKFLMRYPSLHAQLRDVAKSGSSNTVQPGFVFRGAELVGGLQPAGDQYLSRGDHEKDGEVMVDEVLEGIRRELAAYREGT